MSANQYTLDALLYQRDRLLLLIKQATYSDQLEFYQDCLDDVNKDIENINKNKQNNDKIAQ
jgi:hypothetical protein